MTLHTWLLRIYAAVIVILIPFIAYAQDAVNSGTRGVRNTGGSAIWVFANISYAGMRAQNNPSVGWRVISFIFGFPGTVLTLIVVKEGSERAYGIDLPRRRE